MVLGNEGRQDLYIAIKRVTTLSTDINILFNFRFIGVKCKLLEKNTKHPFPTPNTKIGYKASEVNLRRFKHYLLSKRHEFRLYNVRKVPRSQI